MNGKFLSGILAMVAVCLGLIPGNALFGDVVIPGDNAAVEGAGSEGTSLGFFSNSAQVVYNADLVQAAGLNIGDVITGLSFRVDSTFLGPTFSVNDYIIALGTSLNSAGNLNPDFTTNRGTDYLVVHTGALAYDGSEYQTGGAPNEFGPVIVFNSSFTYSGGDLLLEYTHSLVPNGDSAADAVSDFVGVQSQFSTGFNTTMEAFGGFGQDFAPVVQFQVAEPSVCADPSVHTTFRGFEIGTPMVGDFAGPDGVAASFNPGFTINDLEAPVWLIFDYADSASDNAQVTSRAGTPGLEMTVEYWDGTAYVVIGTAPETFNTYSTETFSLGGASADRVRVGWRQVGFVINFPWVVEVDAVELCN